MQDDKLQPELKTGTVLKDTEREYTITEVLAHGGFSIVYSARTDGEDEVVIKEIFPNTDEFFRNIHQVVWCLDPYTGEKYRKLAEREYHYGNEIVSKSTSGRMIVLQQPLQIESIDGYPCKDMAEGYYYLLESVRGKGMFLEDLLKKINACDPEYQRFSRVYVAANITFQILEVLKDIHEAGFIHGDLSFANLFVNEPDLETGDLGTISILDFGATHKVEELSGEYEVNASTLRNMAPEIRTKCGDVSYNSDVYSVGMMMWDMLFYHTAEGKRRDSFSDRERDTFISPSAAIKLGCRNREEVRLLNAILKQSVSMDPQKRYFNASQMGNDVSRLIRMLEMPEE